MKTLVLFTVAVLLMAPAVPAVAESSEEKTGRELYENILAEMPIYTEEKLVSYVKAVGQKIVSVADTRGLTFTFTVIDDETINAFALPGGYIFVHRGLIGYLNSEAELASVLAHEVAHVTERHHSRQKNAATGSQVIAGVLGVLTGSYDVAEAGALWGATIVSGFGRDMELEADKVGAEYLLEAGYDPQAMIEVVSLLKDNERLQKKKDREMGRKTPNYHGLFATHPRNDTRLREVINEAGKLPKKMDAELNVTPFRVATDGLVWGKNYGVQKLPDSIYQDERRAFRFSIPSGWAFREEGGVILGKPEDKSATLKISSRARTLETPDKYIKTQLNIPLIKKSEPLNVNRLQGYTGMVPESGGQDKRLAVIYYGRTAYIFEGEFSDAKQAREMDKQVLAVIKSFRPVSRRALVERKSQEIHYVKATSSTTFAALAQYLKLGKFGEDELRIINGYYPRGEPKPGEWIKIIQ